jgi:uncharacterized protein (UPF0335 family)
MKRSEAIREIWEILETSISDSSDKAKEILLKIEELGMSPPETSREIKDDELTEFHGMGYDSISEDDIIVVREWDDEHTIDKSKLN